ncbi:MAG: urease accessory protein UreF, partial [Spirulina sp. SIO3F2]|nr:urease accessory protein UreF [Spirulina sp. SIO3F2]
MTDSTALLRLLQLVSPALPIGAYSYSEGLETLVESGIITTAEQFADWLTQILRYGTIRLEAAVMLRAYDATLAQQSDTLQYWNQWLSAARETAELRQSSWQMGRSLAQLFLKLEPELAVTMPVLDPCNYTVAFGQVAAHWQIERQDALLGYLQSWLSHSINA